MLELKLRATDDELVERFKRLESDSDVADLLEVPLATLRLILYIRRGHHPYRVFHIAKRRGGGEREIAEPHPSVKILQEKLLRVLSLVYRPRPTTHGFVRGKSIVSNAQEHVQKKLVLNVDIEHFFPAIHFGRIVGMLTTGPHKIGYSAAVVISQICCFDGRFPGVTTRSRGDVRGYLPQGAPTSPIISNMICMRLDRQLAEFAKTYRWWYSRYADDLTFSSKRDHLPTAFGHRQSAKVSDIILGQELTKIIVDNGFKVNLGKLRLHGARTRQVVTGLVVNRAPNVPREYIRSTRAMIHKARIHGIDVAQQELYATYYKRSRNPHLTLPPFPNVLRGRLAFVSMVKGTSDPVYQNLVRQALLVPGLLEPPGPTCLVVPKREFTVERRWEQWQEIHRRSVFHIEVERDGRQSGGTAFAVARSLIATAAHNLLREDGERGPLDKLDLSPLAEKALVRDYEVWTHPLYGPEQKAPDIAVVRVPGAGGLGICPLPMRRDPPTVGEEVAAFGFPLAPGRNPEMFFRAGRVESLTTDYYGLIKYIQVDFRGDGGFSGGPLIDRRGRVVGVVVEDAIHEGKQETTRFTTAAPISYLDAPDFSGWASSLPDHLPGVAE